MAFLCRSVTLSDANAIAQLHAKNWQMFYQGIWRDDYLTQKVLADRQEVWQTRLMQAPVQQHILGVYQEETLVGFVCVVLDQDEKWGSLLDNLHVSHRYQGLGLGKKLMQAAAAIVQAQSSKPSLYLWVLEANHQARRFYDRLGAIHPETLPYAAPDGGTYATCRYAWPHVETLIF